MPYKPHVVYTLCSNPCPLVSAMDNLDYIHAKLLKTHAITEGPRKLVEIWLRVHGLRKSIEEYVSRLRGSKGVSVTEVSIGRYSALLRLVLDTGLYCASCADCCPYTSQPPYTLLDSIIVTPRGVLRRHIVLRRSDDNIVTRGCRVIAEIELEDCGFSLTPRQEDALVAAYREGYYSFPRRTSLKKLAEKLGLSVSSLAELLHRAEAKIIESFLYTELPHLMLEHTEPYPAGSSGKRRS